MLFDLDSPAALRERASIIKTNDLEQGNQGLPTTAVGSSSKFGITADEIGKFESNIESIARYGGPQGIARLLKVEPSKGIDGTPDDIQRRAEAFGTNTYPVKESTPFWVYVWEAFQDETLLILIICAAASLAVGMTTENPKEGWYDGGGVCFAILCCVTVASVSDYKQAQQFQRLNDEKRKIYVNVTRAGKREKPSIFELVVGDIVHLSIGDQIPADGVLITGRSLVVDESSMTGESDPLMKDEEEEPFLMSGCKILDGFGTMLVTAVGMRTEWGRVMATLTEENDEETPLQARLNSLAANIGKVGLAVAVVCFVVCLIRLLCTIDLKQFSTADGREIVDYFAVAVTIVVVAVPEGLPLAVTLSLAYSMKQMMNDRALVRHLAACETMGSATAICSDKTGTLTMNQMAVVTSWVCGKLREPDDLGEPFNNDVLKLLFEAICLNTNGVVQHVEGSDVPEAAGTPTEVAVLNWGVKLGADFDKIKKDTAVLEVDAFNSTKKRMGVITKTADGKAWVHWKGASEVVLSQCTQIMDAEGNVVNITPEKLEELQGIISSFANAALRTLCLGCKEIAVPEARSRRQSVTLPEDGLVCLAVVGIKDPCRPGVPEAVQKCQLAGIKVRMVTGDNLITAKAIATECGILTEHGTAIEGKTFRAMTADEQYDILPSVQVMARSSPTDKYTMVKRLLELGEIVAVTGDGTNDAPALHEASIGLAMGIAGTEVAKESSDIIIMDDNFASIVKVVRWGRSVYFNIQKFIQFQLTVNGVALTLNFVSAIFEGHAPLTAVQLLWVNLIMDTMGALALATEPPTDALMAVPPIRKREPLITNIMWRNILAQSAYQLALLLTLQFRGIELLDLRKDVGASPPPPPPSKHSYVPTDRAHKELMTMIFDSFVFCQIFNEINARHPVKFNVFKGFFSNKLFLYVIAFTCLVQVMLSEFCGTFTSTVKIGHRHWIMCVGLGAISLPLAVVVKLIPVPQRALSTYIFFWQKDVSQHLTFRHGRSIKQTMLARTPSGLQKTSSMKFYTAGAGDEASKIIEAVTGAGAPATSRRCWDCWPSTPAPSASTDTGNPAKRHSNVAWS